MIVTNCKSHNIRNATLYSYIVGIRLVINLSKLEKQSMMTSMIIDLSCNWIFNDERGDDILDDDDDDVYFIELQHVGYKIQYPYGPAKTA